MASKKSNAAAQIKKEQVEERAIDINVGDTVRIKPGAPIYNQNNFFSPWVYESFLFVREICGSRVIVSSVQSGAITGAVDIKDLIKV